MQVLHQVGSACGGLGIFGQIHFVIPQPLVHLRGFGFVVAGDVGEDVQITFGHAQLAAHVGEIMAGDGEGAIHVENPVA